MSYCSWWWWYTFMLKVKTKSNICFYSENNTKNAKNTKIPLKVCTSLKLLHFIVSKMPNKKNATFVPSSYMRILVRCMWKINVTGMLKSNTAALRLFGAVEKKYLFFSYDYLKQKMHKYKTFAIFLQIENIVFYIFMKMLH